MEDNIRDSWAGLGIAFATSSPVRNADPEKTLIKSIPEFEKDRKLLVLVLSWLSEYGKVFHVERLKALVVDLSAHDLAWLGGVADYALQGIGDHRWNAITSLIKDKLGGKNKLPRFATSKLDELQAQRKGSEPAFSNFGLIIPKLEREQMSRKILPDVEVVKRNLWLRLRFLFGTNWRADVASVMIQKLAENSYQAGKILGCSNETAYRNWKALKIANAEELLLRSA